MKKQKVELEAVLLALKATLPEYLPDTGNHEAFADRLVSEIKKRTPEAAPKGVKVAYVPHPLATTGDPGNVWMLSRQENLSAEEANQALERIQEDFWNSKKGLKLLRDRVEKSLVEVIRRSPAAAWRDRGLKRHYKDPEPVVTVQAERYTGKVTDRYKGE